MFWRNIKKYSDKSLYQIVRHGTYSKTGRKQYMPLYTEEKMSDEQLNDLVAYIKQLAKK
jgi:mono/diheme cytochrome c family protein